MPFAEFQTPGPIFAATSTNKADGRRTGLALCNGCLAPSSELFTPSGQCFTFLDPGVQLPKWIFARIDNPVGPGVSVISDTIQATFEGNAGTLHRVAYVQGPNPQALGSLVGGEQRLDLLIPSSPTCFKQNGLTNDPIVTIASGWWADTIAGQPFFEYLPTADTVNINPFILYEEPWPANEQTSDKRIVATSTVFFEYRLNGATGLLSAEFVMRYNASNPGQVISGPHGNCYLTNAFLRDSDGARIDVFDPDLQEPAGFDVNVEDVPDYSIKAYIQINSDGSWFQTGEPEVSGGSGSMTLTLG